MTCDAATLLNLGPCHGPVTPVVDERFGRLPMCARHAAGNRGRHAAYGMLVVRQHLDAYDAAQRSAA